MFKQLEIDSEEILLILPSDVVKEGPGLGCTSPACNSKQSNQEMQAVITK